LQIRLPTAARFVVGVADFIAKKGLLAADSANSRHRKTPVSGDNPHINSKGYQMVSRLITERAHQSKRRFIGNGGLKSQGFDSQRPEKGPYFIKMLGDSPSAASFNPKMAC
jgi:hypothetical protein